MTDFDHAPWAEQWFTTTGGYVLTQHAQGDDSLPVFACTANADDEGVALTEEDCLSMARWLLAQVSAEVLLREGRSLIDGRTSDR